MVSLTLFIICYQAVRRITRPLAELQKSWARADNLTPIAIHSATLEIDAVVSALNDLVSRLTSTLITKGCLPLTSRTNPRTPLAGCVCIWNCWRNASIDVDTVSGNDDQMMESVSSCCNWRAGQSIFPVFINM